MKRTLIPSSLILLAALALTLFAADSQKPDEEQPGVKQTLLGHDHEAMSNLETSILAERLQMIQDLIAVLQEQPSGENLNGIFRLQGPQTAAYLLGQLSAEEAVRPLAERIEIMPQVISEKTEDTVCPCYAALVHIGKPGSLECLQRLATVKYAKPDAGPMSKVELYLRVIRRVEGDDIARFMLQNAIDKEQDKDRKANLTAALELLDKRNKEEAERQKRLQEQRNAPAPPAEGDKPVPDSQKRDAGAIFQKCLPNGDVVKMTEKTTLDTEQKEVTEYSVSFKRLNAENEEIIWNMKMLPVPETLKDMQRGFHCIPFDAFARDEKVYLLFAAFGRLYVDTIHVTENNKSDVASHIEIRRESDSEGEVTQEACLFEIGGSIHVVVGYLVGTQEIWRLDGDKATLLWKITAEELKRQKEQAQKESTTPEENAKPETSTEPGGETTPPATDEPAPPAEGGATPPASEQPAPPSDSGNP